MNVMFEFFSHKALDRWEQCTRQTDLVVLDLPALGPRVVDNMLRKSQNAWRLDLNRLVLRLGQVQFLYRTLGAQEKSPFLSGESPSQMTGMPCWLVSLEFFWQTWKFGLLAAIPQQETRGDAQLLCKVLLHVRECNPILCF